MRLRLLLLTLAATAAPAWAQPPPDAPAATVAASGNADQAVIPPGMEELLGAMLGSGQSLPGGCTLSDGQIDSTVVRGTYGCADGKVVLELVHPGAAPNGSVRTEQFAVVVASGTAPPGFVDAVVSRVRAREGEFAWKVISGGSESRFGGMRSVLLTAAVAVVGFLLLAAVIRAVLRIRRGGDAT